MAKSFFPEEMLSSGTLSVDMVFSKLSHFEIELHLLHLQTTSYAEHKALLGLYEAMSGFRDEITEKMMGYSNTRVKASPIIPLCDYSLGKPQMVVRELLQFSKQLENFASSNNMPDIENISQSLSGEAAKTLYLLTLS